MNTKILCFLRSKQGGGVLNPWWVQEDDNDVWGEEGGEFVFVFKW